MQKLQAYLHVHWRWIIGLAFPLLSLAMHAHLFEHPLQGIHAWRQCETASNIVLFATHDYSIMDPHVYSLEWEDGLKRMEFPIMQWLFGRAIHYLGHEILVMRLLSWLLGFVTILGFFRLTDLIFKDKALAVAAAWCWMFSPVIFYYSINPLPDNFSLMLAVWGLAFYMQWHRAKHLWAMLVSFACLSLSTATKLPFVLLFAAPLGGLLGELLRNRGRNLISYLSMGMAGLLILAPALWWYAWVIPQWTGNGVIKGVLDTEVADIPVLIKTIGKNLLVILPEVLLNYASVLFFVWGIWIIWKEKLYQHVLSLPFGLMAMAIFAYFIYEINMISSVHDYYLFPFLPGIFILVALGLHRLRDAVWPWVRTLAIVALCILPVTAGLRAYTRWGSKGMPKDLVANEATLREATPTDARVIYGNDLSPHISLFHLHRQGWTLDESEFNPEKFNDWLAKGAEYLYSNARTLEENAVVRPHLGEMVGEWGQTRVWRLR